jgi:hypothetical protein
MKKNLIFLFIFGFFLNSEAQIVTRCFNLFSSQKMGSIEYFAEFIDSLNKQSNTFLFEKSVAAHIHANLTELVFTDRVSARYRAFKLRRILNELKAADKFDTYDFENLSLKLERLTYLTDPTVTDSMPSEDKIIYKQAQHSILSKGLENFLFDSNSHATRSMKSKFFEALMVPFKDIYSRWYYSFLNMPKLNGAVLPFDLAMKIAWSGIENNKALLEPYFKSAKFKNYFNKFSKSYNWMIVTAIFAGIPAYVYYTYKTAIEKGHQHFASAMVPVEENIVQVQVSVHSEIDGKKRLKNFIVNFKKKNNREPTRSEIDFIKNKIDENN